jgi:hypothetical protein
MNLKKLIRNTLSEEDAVQTAQAAVQSQPQTTQQPAQTQQTDPVLRVQTILKAMEQLEKEKGNLSPDEYNKQYANLKLQMQTHYKETVDSTTAAKAAAAAAQRAAATANNQGTGSLTKLQQTTKQQQDAARTNTPQSKAMQPASINTKGEDKPAVSLPKGAEERIRNSIPRTASGVFVPTKRANQNTPEGRGYQSGAAANGKPVPAGGRLANGQVPDAKLRTVY